MAPAAIIATRKLRNFAIARTRVQTACIDVDCCFHQKLAHQDDAGLNEPLTALAVETQGIVTSASWSIVALVVTHRGAVELIG
jgi:hypothetical protein